MLRNEFSHHPLNSHFMDEPRNVQRGRGAGSGAQLLRDRQVVGQRAQY